MGGGGDGRTEAIEEVDGQERLELMESQIQMVRKQEKNGGWKVLTAVALMGELILDQLQENLMGDKDAESINEAAVLKAAGSKNR